MREICFLAASRGNAFMMELLRAVAGAVAEEGVPVSFQLDRYPPFADDVAYVTIPHEFFVLAPDGGAPSPGHLRRTVGYCVELPGSPWFVTTCHYGWQLGALVDIRQSGTAALRLLGLEAVHAPLGYTAAWDRWGRDEEADRPLDVLYMGAAESRRDRVLAGYGETLARRSSRLLIPQERAKPDPNPSFLVGDEKYDLLASAKTLLNLHRDGTNALEWPRVLEAISNGCVVITERSLDTDPLVPGEHVVVGRAESLCLLADRLLDDPERLRRLRVDAYDFVRSELPIAPGARRLVDVADSVVAKSLRRAGTEGLRHPPTDGQNTLPGQDLAPIRAALKRVLVESLETRRALAELGHRGAPEGGGPEPRPLAMTPAYVDARPRVTIAISLHNYESEVVDALSSVASSDYEDHEILLLDDASTDSSAAAAQQFMDEHPWLPALLMQRRRNAGLARTRNALAAQARGELIFVLDADNGLYPHGLRRLVEALDGDPAAAFAYPIIAVREHGQPVALLSAHGWDPARLAEGNYVDAMALIRRDAFLEIGGYHDDPRLVGFEDYDLWCRMAERGWHGVHVPQILAWYRRTRHSMLSLTGVDLTEARSLLAARAPGVFAPAD